MNRAEKSEIIAQLTQQRFEESAKIRDHINEARTHVAINQSDISGIQNQILQFKCSGGLADFDPSDIAKGVVRIIADNWTTRDQTWVIVEITKVMAATTTSIPSRRNGAAWRWHLGRIRARLDPAVPAGYRDLEHKRKPRLKSRNSGP